jgi:hypothetical protein
VKSGPETEVTVDLDLKIPEDLDWNISQDGNVVTVTCRARSFSIFGWPLYIFQVAREPISMFQCLQKRTSPLKIVPAESQSKT